MARSLLLKWLPWRFIIKRAARSQGILDPILLLTRLARFGKLGDIGTPGDLLRAGAMLHARGLINNQAIQHNLDWIWPYWVVRQFDPRDVSFVPRAFSLTHINLTHRNWTAVGLPSGGQTPIVDPAGLVTPFFDGWSVDAWVVAVDGQDLIPSRCQARTQRILQSDNLIVRTDSKDPQGRSLSSSARVEIVGGQPACVLDLQAFSEQAAWLAVSFRPCNPEGVSFIHELSFTQGGRSWLVNGKHWGWFEEAPDRAKLSRYEEGDVFYRLFEPPGRKEIACPVGMATGAALFRIAPGEMRKTTLTIALAEKDKRSDRPTATAATEVAAKAAAGARNQAGDEAAKRPPHPTSDAGQQWKQVLGPACVLSTADRGIQFLYDTAVRTLALNTADEVYAGPYTYRRFWVRDASFILQSLVCINLIDRAERFIDALLARQNSSGYFYSHGGEWDANGEVLWFLERFCRLSNRVPRDEWWKRIRRGADWIIKKRLRSDGPELHSGLLPAGFSAEHFGPNDYYYWDDFWAVSGLRAAAYLASQVGQGSKAGAYWSQSEDLMSSIERSLGFLTGRLGMELMPASPYRRMDSAAVGSLVAGYPLQLFGPGDRRLVDTANYLLDHCMIHGGLFHDMSHSGINPYLTLHIAQVLLRAGDRRWCALMEAIADLASATGQWPEAVHPHTSGGCMGDGQHVWAASEWLMMVRNCLVREEEECLVLCPGVRESWLSRKAPLTFGPAPTALGSVCLSVEKKGRKAKVRCSGDWYVSDPCVRVGPSGQPMRLDEEGRGEVTIEAWSAS
jgi:hypothetical protein